MRVIRGLATGVLVLGPALLVPAIAEDAKTFLRAVHESANHIATVVREDGLVNGVTSLVLPYGDGPVPPSEPVREVALVSPPTPATYTTQGEAQSAADDTHPLPLVPPAPILALPPEKAVESREASGAGAPSKESAALTSPANTKQSPAATPPAIVPPAPIPATQKESAGPAPALAALATPKPADAAPPPAPVTAPQKAPDAKAKEQTPAAPAPAGKKDAKPALPAKQLFAAAKSPAPLAARSIGFYAKGCLAGAKPLAVDGPAWQVMRLSRNRFYGHPDLIALIERLANDVKENKEWPGLLVGDISQPRGGPMLTGHASHQVGLDADIWLTPMPDHRLTETQRENLSATSMLAADDISVNPKVWGDGQVKLIKRAASYKTVERILVHPAIKKALCDATAGQTDRTWLRKVRPYFGHYYHFHVRIACPAGSTTCKAQPPVPGDEGCGEEIKDWIKRVTPKPPPVQEARPTEPSKPAPKKPEITLADLPGECRAVLASGGNVPPTEAVMVDTSKDAAPEPAAASDADAPQASTATAKAQLR